MKLVNYAVIAAVALFTMASCNKTESNTTKTYGAVQIEFNGMASKAIGTPTTGNNGETAEVQVSSISITLQSAKGTKTMTFPNAEAEGTALEQANAYVFEDVVIPSVLKVAINGGTKAAGEDNLSSVIGTGLAIPAYGETNTFTETDKKTSKGQKIYTATVNLVNNYAHLEFSGLKKKEVASSIFSTATIDGVFLDEVKTDIGGTKFTFNYNTQGFEDVASYLKDAVGTNFMDASATFPTGNNCFSYNVYGEDLPLFTIAFSNCTLKSGASINPIRYAQIKGYKTADGSAITNFAKGSIYRITEIVVADENMSVDPGADEYVAVQAIVTIAPWNIVDTQVEW